MRRLILSLLIVAAPAAAQERSVPYWASIAAGQAAMRAGPDRSYPTTWIYQRRDLPLRVVQVLGPWRRVQEQDGTTGWMLSMLLAARRTGIVRGGLQPIRDAASADGRVLWQAEEGVVGRLSHCDGQWCRIQVGARIGYMSQDALWGVAPGEVFR